jgi:hypothetical protein
MHETKIESAVHEMMLAIERRELLWSLPMIRALELQSRGIAMEWVIAFLESQLARFASPDNRTVRDGWLEELKKLKTANATNAELGRRCRDIWYYEGARDKWQTAASRLYEAFAGLKAGHDVGYHGALAMTIGVLATDEHNVAGAECTESLVRLFCAFRER